MDTATYRRVAGGALAVLLAAGAGAALAGDEDPDGVDLRADLLDGDAELELEARNVKAAVCFIWRTDALLDGDAVHSRILNRSTGLVVLDLGAGDQFVEGTASGCELPPSGDVAYRQVFAQPGNHVVEVRVVDRPGSTVRPVLRSGPLDASSG